MIVHDGPGLARVAPNDQSLPSRVQFVHQSGPYESCGNVRTTIRRRIPIRVFLDGSWVQLKQLLHQKSRKSQIWMWDLEFSQIWIRDLEFLHNDYSFEGTLGALETAMQNSVTPWGRGPKRPHNEC